MPLDYLHKQEIPEGKIQFFESFEDLRKNTLLKAEKILTNKEKLINLLKLFNEYFSIREMAQILKIDRKTVSVYLKKLKISEEKCLDFLEKKEKLILDSIDKKKFEEEKYNKQYILMQEQLSFFNSKIPEKYLCILLNIKLPTLMAYKKGKIRKIGEEILDSLLLKIKETHTNYINKINYIKSEINNLIKKGKTQKEIHTLLNIPETTFYNFLNDTGNLKYKYVEDSLYILKEEKLKQEELKEEKLKQEELKEEKLKQEEIFIRKLSNDDYLSNFINLHKDFYKKYARNPDYYKRLFTVFMKNNIPKLKKNWYDIDNTLEKLYNEINVDELIKIEIGLKK